jgi:hypothetical protein
VIGPANKPRISWCYELRQDMSKNWFIPSKEL